MLTPRALKQAENIVAKPMDRYFFAYEQPSFISAKSNGGQQYEVQNVIVIDGNADGWLKIQTWEGDKWINLSDVIEFEVIATAYSVENSSPSERITAANIDIGKNPNIKLIAVDPKVIPLRTKEHVEGHGEAIAGDTGGAIKGNRIDVLFPTEKQEIRLGRKTVKIKI
ncbi:3D domain-containing protein [Bacillus mycoides]|uniref:3D domain-containing protein n=1 Tax=Bacillus mycoides TaxID=1405 RepID=UPI000A27F042|nr:hypothetical protein BTJ44_01042 [Bacillus mycoides]